MTYYSKYKIPSKVFENINKYAFDYTLSIYDDNDCLNFLKENFNDKIINRFLSLKKGAHKADLFRYCILYKNGGIYMDIKTELIKPLNEIFTNNYTYTVLSMIHNTIYQGILATYKENTLFLYLIENIVNTTDEELDHDYQLFTRVFYNKLKDISMDNNIDSFNPFKTSQNDEYYLFQEICTDKKEECNGCLDRYGLCCFIYNKNEKIIKTRFSDFPW